VLQDHKDLREILVHREPQVHKVHQESLALQAPLVRLELLVHKVVQGLLELEYKDHQVLLV
jgi:hypothetical protein